MTGNAVGEEGRLDRRVRKTRQALRDALVELILDRGYAAVTVGDIVERADVGRTTFYAHFTDKDDLLVSGFAEMHQAQPVVGNLTGVDRLSALARDMVHHADSERRLYRAVFGRQGGGPLQARLERELTVFVEEALREAHPAARPADVSMAARMSIMAFLGLIAWWLDGDVDLPPDAIARAFDRFVRPALASMLGGSPA